MLTAFLLSHLYKSKFIATDYKFLLFVQILFLFSRSKNNYTNGYIDSVAHISSGYRLPNGNDCFDTNTKEGLHQLLSSIDQQLSRNSTSNSFRMIYLPFDQKPGLLCNLLNRKDILYDFRTNVCLYSNSLTAQKDISIHIRRGDVNEKSTSAWWIGDDVYIKLYIRCSTQILFHGESRIHSSADYFLFKRCIARIKSEISTANIFISISQMTMR